MRRLQKPQRIRKSDEKEMKEYRFINVPHPPSPLQTLPISVQKYNDSSAEQGFRFLSQSTFPSPSLPPPQLINMDRSLSLFLSVSLSPSLSLSLPPSQTLFVTRHSADGRIIIQLMTIYKKGILKCGAFRNHSVLESQTKKKRKNIDS